MGLGANNVGENPSEQTPAHSLIRFRSPGQSDDSGLSRKRLEIDVDANETDTQPEDAEMAEAEGPANFASEEKFFDEPLQEAEAPQPFWRQDFQGRAEFFIKCALGEIEQLNQRLGSIEENLGVEGPENENARLALNEAGEAYKAELEQEYQLCRGHLELWGHELENVMLRKLDQHFLEEMQKIEIQVQQNLEDRGLVTLQVLQGELHREHERMGTWVAEEVKRFFVFHPQEIVGGARKNFIGECVGRLVRPTLPK